MLVLWYRGTIYRNDTKEMPIKKILTIDVKQPSQVGSDRIANAIAAYKIYKKNFIIVDFGTATTFDIVSKDGYYKGGIISPGIELSLKSVKYLLLNLDILASILSYIEPTSCISNISGKLHSCISFTILGNLIIFLGNSFRFIR